MGIYVRLSPVLIIWIHDVHLAFQIIVILSKQSFLKSLSEKDGN